MFQIIDRAGIRIGPAVEVFLMVGGNRAEFGLLTAGGNHELIVEEKRRTAFAFCPTLLAVAQQLVNGFGDGIFGLGRFAFNHHHRQPVQKQDNVRHNMVFRTQNPYLELAHRNKAVVVPAHEIHKPHRRALFACFAVLADTGIFQKKVKNIAVVGNQAGAGKTGCKLLDHFFNLIVFHPVINDLKLLVQNR